MPKLSIITICFNNREGLEKTISSVRSQSFTDFELIVIDGGSTDGSVDVIKKYLDIISNWVSEKDKGIYDAQNKGWRKASGEYCLFLNSGDYLVNDDTLKNVFKESPSEDLVYGDIEVDNGKNPIYTIGQPDPFTFEDIIRSTMFHPATFIKRNLLEERGGYDESFRIVADYDFFLEMLFVKKCSRKHVNIPIAVFDTKGIGSDPNNKFEHDAERRNSQLKYFPLKEILATEKIARKKIPKSVRIKKSVSHIPIIRELTDFSFYVWQKSKSKFR